MHTLDKWGGGDAREDSIEEILLYDPGELDAVVVRECSRQLPETLFAEGDARPGPPNGER